MMESKPCINCETEVSGEHMFCRTCGTENRLPKSNRLATYSRSNVFKKLKPKKK